MKALQFARTGSLDALEVVDRPVPVPGDGEVLIEVKAAGLNPSDVKNVLGRFPYTTLPRVPGRDFGGVIVDGPQEVRGLEVWGTGREPGFVRDGSHAQYMTLPLAGVSKKPGSLSFAQAACCGVPYTTAWDALERTHTGTDTTVLIIGIGAVGRAALGLARVRGAQVVAAVRRREQADELAAEGVQVVVFQEPELLADAVRSTFAEGAEVVFDTTGFLLTASVAALAPFGRIAVIAAPADGYVRLPVLNLYRRGGSVVGINSLLYSTAQCAQMLDRIGSFFDAGLLSVPVGYGEVPLADAVNVYREIDRGAGGKTVLLP